VCPPPGAGARPPAPRPLDEEERARLEEAILTGDTVALHYVSRRGVRSRRNVVPYAAHPAQAPVTLVAYDLATGATRTYRLDRIVRIGDATEAAEETDVEPARSP